MHTQTNIADIVVHLHPDQHSEYMARLDDGLRAHDGVVSVHFDTADHPHALVIAYNPAAASSSELLAEVRKYDNKAVMAGL